MKPEAKKKRMKCSMNITHPLLSLGVIFPKRLRPKMLKKDKDKTHRLVHSKHFFFFFLYCSQYMPKTRPIQQIIVYL